MDTRGWKVDWEKDSKLLSSRIVLSTTGDGAEVSWDVMEAAGQGCLQHSEGQKRKGLL